MSWDAAMAVTGFTIWLLIALAVILYTVNAPRRLTQAPLAVLALYGVWFFIASVDAECSGGPCAGIKRIGGATETVVLYVIPGIAVSLTLGAIAYGLVRHRTTSR